MMMIKRIPREHFYSHSFLLISKPNAYICSLRSAPSDKMLSSFINWSPPLWAKSWSLYSIKIPTFIRPESLLFFHKIHWHDLTGNDINPLNLELNPICYLLALLAHHFLHVSRLRVKSLNLRLLMSYIYIYIYIYMCVCGAPILDVSRSHTTTQHSR